MLLWKVGGRYQRRNCPRCNKKKIVIVNLKTTLGTEFLQFCAYYFQTNLGNKKCKLLYSKFFVEPQKPLRLSTLKIVKNLLIQKHLYGRPKIVQSKTTFRHFIEYWLLICCSTRKTKPNSASPFLCKYYYNNLQNLLVLQILRIKAAQFHSDFFHRTIVGKQITLRQGKVFCALHNSSRCVNK